MEAKPKPEATFDWAALERIREDHRASRQTAGPVGFITEEYAARFKLSFSGAQKELRDFTKAGKVRHVGWRLCGEDSRGRLTVRKKVFNFVEAAP